MIDFNIGGISHKTCSLALRERLALAPAQQEQFLAQFKAQTGVSEVALVMTCNRNEWFWSGGDTPQTVLRWLGNYFGLPAQEWQEICYLHTGYDAVHHLMSVAAGLDSMMLGELQITGQIKNAFSQASQLNLTGKVFQQVFPTAFATVKKVRAQTNLGMQPTSVAYAAAQLARCIFKDLPSLTVLLVGAGNTIGLAARHFHKMGVRRLIAANRTLEHATQLAQTYAGQAITLSEIPQYLTQADVIVTATASANPIITRAQVQAAMQGRRRPLYLIDLAVPRDIEPDVASLDGVYVYNLDDLQKQVHEAQHSCEKALLEARELVDIELAAFIAAQQAREKVPTIMAYRQRMALLRDEEMAKAMRLLAGGMPAAEVLQHFATALTKKLIHEPTVLLKG